MLTFEQQEKIFAVLLHRDSNHKCADCNSIHPTWASLDFGVFVCSNCSGSHRALGPTITRVKSTTLDRWHKDWIQNVKIGNKEINQYWEADSETANLKKPKNGATLEEHNRFINDKYRRKKFVKDTSASDPLTAYKNGTYRKQAPVREIVSVVAEPPKQKHFSIVDQKIQVPQKLQQHSKSETFCLLDDLGSDDIVAQKQSKVKQNGDSLSNKKQPDEQQFSEFVEVEYQPQQEQSKQNVQKILTFQELMKGPQLATHQSHQHPNQQAQTNYPLRNNNLHIHNSYANQSQTLYHQYHHNPYVGYVPHYSNGNPQNPFYNNHNHQVNPHSNQYQGQTYLQNTNIHRPNSYQPAYQYQPSGSIQGFTLN